MSKPAYVSYVASISATVSIPIEQILDVNAKIDPTLFHEAFERRLKDLGSDPGEWNEAVELTDPHLEDVDGNPFHE